MVKDEKKLIESGEVTRISSGHRNRRVPVHIHTVDDKGNRIKTIFSAEAAPDHIINGQTWRNDAENLINSWENTYLVDQARSNLIRSGNLRIDMQGIINRNNQIYYNLQIQVNVKRNGGESTTVAQIIIPGGIPERYVRRAFLESFDCRARVFIDVSSYS